MSIKFKRNEKILWREEKDGSCLLFIPETGRIKVLNEVAALIWKLSDGNCTIEDMAKAIMNNFDANDKKMVISDINKFGKELEKKKLIRIYR